MDPTFISIHDLSDEARILYCSDSIVDILGHTPDEVLNKSVWEFFHPDELPFAKGKHSRGVRLDKAAVLAYCLLRNRQGEWVGCECCFSVVYDVMVCCTSVYRNGMQSQSRAVQAPVVRKLFASSPKDPRYHMLSHLSSKFDLGPDSQTHEPRAALFLNRFTRTLTVMYATSGIEQIVGIPSESMKGKSFYYCIAETCLQEAVNCLESAKSNESIAYLRFLFRDPSQNDPPADPTTSESEDESMTDVTASEDESDVGTDLDNTSTPGDTGSGHTSHSTNGTSHNRGPHTIGRYESGDSGGSSNAHQAMFGNSNSSVGSPQSDHPAEPIELEAVISCTTDGLVVCLRRARPTIPGVLPAQQTQQYHGVYAAPWAPAPIFSPAPPQMPPYPLGARHPAMQQAGASLAFQDAFMQTIRDVAVFAWALTGINGNLAEYARGKPVGQSQPPEGLPVWNPLPDPTQLEDGRQSAALSGYVSGSNSSASNDPFGFGDPGLR